MPLRRLTGNKTPTKLPSSNGHGVGAGFPYNFTCLSKDDGGRDKESRESKVFTVDKKMDVILDWGPDTWDRDGRDEVIVGE